MIVQTGKFDTVVKIAYSMDNYKEYNSEFKGIWIPREYLECKDLTTTERDVLSIITALDNGKGCYATNRYFGKILTLTKNHISTIINSLNEKDFISCYVDQSEGNKRIINISTHIDKLLDPVSNLQDTYTEKPLHPIRENPIHNNKDYNKNINTLSLTFLKENDIYKYESLKDKYKDQINNWSDFKDAFNSQCELDEIPFEVNKISARLEKYARHWVKNEKPIKKDVIKNIDPEKINESFEWFINMFNKVSNRDFKGTPQIKKLWLKQVNNGFTGNEMILAMKNLYHPTNEWHKKREYQFATPEFLLKDGNLNRLMNFKKPTESKLRKII